MLAALLGLSAPTGAQATHDGETVVSLRFEGVHNLSESTLRDVIVTEAVKCKSLFYAPLCWITDSSLFTRKPELDSTELQRDALRIRVQYWREGYRSAQAEPRVEEVDGGVAVAFAIDEGPPTVVDTVVVEGADSILAPRDLRAAELPRPDRPIDIIELDSAALRLASLLRERGHADAVVHDTAVVRADGDSATVRVTIEPGPIATIGAVEVTGNEEVSERTILRLLDLREGQVYRSSQLLEAQRRLYRSELFRQAIMEVGETPDSVKPVRVRVREAPFRAVRVGGGINTLEFVQAEARYTLYNWYGAARRLQFDAAIGNLLAPQLYGRSIFEGAAPVGTGPDIEGAFLDPTWQVSAEVSQPWLFSRRHSISLGVFAHRRSVPAIVVDEGYGSGLTFTRRFSSRATGSATYRFERVRVRAGDLYFCVNFGVCGTTLIEALGGSQTLSPLWLSLTIDRTDDPLAPTRGWSAELDGEHASGATASDFRYNRISGELTHHLRLGPGVLASRVRGGWVNALAGTAAAVGVPMSDAELLHPRKRFYAGGSQSVRGYGENQLGPRILTVDPRALQDSTTADCDVEDIADGTCDPAGVATSRFTPRPLGGNSLIEASVEYRIPIGETLTAAVFLDGATVGAVEVDVPASTRRAITPGFGVRYLSPIGPVRVDLGIRPRVREQLPVITQVTDENGELRLVRLETDLLYDPIGASGGFLRSITSRLQLHLSIGEAF